MRYQQRYQAYAKSNNKTPDEMLTHDQAQYPGGVMCGYILWISTKIREFKKLKPEAFIGGNIADQYGFTNYLFEKGE